MYQQPIDELKLLNSIPGFEELSDVDKLRFRIASFEYKDHPVYSTATLVFTYADHKLKFEMPSAGERASVTGMSCMRTERRRKSSLPCGRRLTIANPWM